MTNIKKQYLSDSQYLILLVWRNGRAAGPLF